MSFFKLNKKENSSIKENELQNNEECKESVNNCSNPNILDPLDCFGMNKEKTDKWMIKCVRIWYYIISFIWFLFGAFTFAPIIFITSKLNVLFKDKKKSFICAIIIYFVTIFLMVVFFYVKK
jgi:hypothetical protein